MTPPSTSSTCAWPGKTVTRPLGLQRTEVPEFEDHHRQYCEATYTDRLDDLEGHILVHKALGNTSGVFKPKRSEIESWPDVRFPPKRRPETERVREEMRGRSDGAG